MTHWMEGDWPTPAESEEVKAMKRLLAAAKRVIERTWIIYDENDELFCEFDEAINEAEIVLFPEDDDPRSMGWVGDDGLP